MKRESKVDIAEIIPLIVAGFSVVLAILSYLKGKRLEKANAAESITKAASELVQQYRDRLMELEEKVDLQEKKLEAQEEKLERQDGLIKRQQAEINTLKRQRLEFINGVRSLCDQIRSLGHDPVWEPTWKPEE